MPWILVRVFPGQDIELMVDVEAVDVQSPEWSSDINVVSGALKLWFRELPEPVLTFGLYDAFIEAARKSTLLVCSLLTCRLR
jgi:hypothetical protein